MPAIAKKLQADCAATWVGWFENHPKGASPYVYGYTMEKFSIFSTGKRRRSFIVNFFRLWVTTILHDIYRSLYNIGVTVMKQPIIHRKRFSLYNKKFRPQKRCSQYRPKNLIQTFFENWLLRSDNVPKGRSLLKLWSTDALNLRKRATASILEAFGFKTWWKQNDAASAENTWTCGKQ